MASTRIAVTAVAGLGLAIAAFSACTAVDIAGKGPGSKAQAQDTRYAKPGFVTYVRNGRLLVFRQSSKELEDYRAQGELAKRVTRIGAGPQGMTILAPDGDTIDAYMRAEPAPSGHQ